MSQGRSQNIVPRRRVRWKHRLPGRPWNETSYADFDLEEGHSTIPLLELFLGGFSHEPRLRYETPVFERLFGKSQLEKIRRGDFEEHHSLVAWLDDRDANNAPRSYNGAMSGEELLKVLRFKRFGGYGMVDAHFRRIYIPNPFIFTIGAVMLASSDRQIPIIRGLIFRHLAGATTFSVEQQVGFDFVLELHVSYHVWRDSSSRCDSRCTDSGPPLRSSFDLSFLSRPNTEHDGYIHECQTSICLTGWDTSTWTALCLTDSYYDDELDAENAYMLPYYIVDEMDDNVPEDALSTAALLADRLSVKDPRAYFFRIAAVHIERIRDEWKNAQFQLCARARKYISNHYIHDPLKRNRGSFRMIELLEESGMFVTNVQEILQRMKAMIRKTITAWSRLMSRDVDQLQEEADEKTCEVLLISLDKITASVEEMEKTLEELSEIEIEIQNFKAQLDMFTAIGTAQRAAASSWTFGLTALAARAMQAFSSGAKPVHGTREQKDTNLTGDRYKFPQMPLSDVNEANETSPQEFSTRAITPGDRAQSQPMPPPVVEGVDMSSAQESSRRVATNGADPTSYTAEMFDGSNLIAGVFTSLNLLDQSSVTESTNTEVPNSTFSMEVVSTQPSSIWEGVQYLGHKDTVGYGLRTSGNNHNILESYDVQKDELQSVASVNEDVQSLDGSAIVLPSLRWAAVSCISDVLTEDSDLLRMYQDADRYLDEERFLRNHERLLKGYYVNLRSQIVTQKQRLAVEFLRLRVHRRLISSRIRSKTKNSDDSIGIQDFNPAFDQAVHREETLRRFLDNVVEPPEQHNANAGDYSDERFQLPQPPDKMRESENEISDEDEGFITDEYLSLMNLEETRNIFKSGQALKDFKQQLHSFLYPTSSFRQPANSTAPMDSTNSFTFELTTWRSLSLIADLFFTVTETMNKATRSRSKRENDFKKLRYKCGCGENIVLEVMEKLPGGIARLKDRLEKDIQRDDTLSCVIHSQTEDSPSAPPTPPIPQAADFRPEGNNSTYSPAASIPTGYSSEEGRATSYSSTSSPQSENTGGLSMNDPQYLLLCVNQKALPVLRNLELSGICSDQFLFQQILLEYKEARRKSDWKPSFLIPLILYNLMSHISRVLKLPKWQLPDRLCSATRILKESMNLSLYKIDKGDFVRFQLVPVRETEVPTRFKYGEFPPSGEVDAGNYLYAPVPMDEVEIRIPLWHLTQPGPHSDKFWIETFPKKLKIRLQRHPGEERPVIGWGIRVNESLNWSHLLFLILVVILLIGGCLGLYLLLKSDDSSAFGLGAFLAAVFAVYIPFQYHSWKEQID